jgi:hypothetical protein
VSAAKSVDEAVAECTRLVGAQFTRSAVGALLKLHAGGELDPTGRASKTRARLADRE